MRLDQEPQVAIDEPVRAHVRADEQPRVGRVGLEADRLDDDARLEQLTRGGAHAARLEALRLAQLNRLQKGTVR